MLGVAGAMMTGCSNDDVEIEQFGKGTELRVSTQAMYDQFKITQYITQQLLSTDYSIGVFVMIYDQNGDLVKEAKETNKTFNNFTVSLDDLKIGSYTAAVVETLVSSEAENEVDWTLEGKEKLSTLKVVNNNTSTHYWYEAVGTSITDFEVKYSENTAVDIIPQGLGTIVNCYFLDFNDSPYVIGSLCSKDLPVGRLLSPIYSGNDRFVYDKYNDSDTWSGRGATLLETEQEEVDLYLIEAGNISLCFAPHALKSDGSLDYSFWSVPYNGMEVTLRDGSQLYGGCYYKGLGDGRDGCAGTFVTSMTQLQDWYDTVSNEWPHSAASAPKKSIGKFLKTSLGAFSPLVDDKEYKVPAYTVRER